MATDELHTLAFDKAVRERLDAMDSAAGWSTPATTKALVHKVFSHLYKNPDVLPRMIIQVGDADEGKFLLFNWLRYAVGSAKHYLRRDDLRTVYTYATRDSSAKVEQKREEIEQGFSENRVYRIVDYWGLALEDYQLPKYFLLADDLGELEKAHCGDLYAPGAISTAYPFQRDKFHRLCNTNSLVVAESVLRSAAGFFGVFVGESLPFSPERLGNTGVRTVVFR